VTCSDVFGQYSLDLSSAAGIGFLLIVFGFLLAIVAMIVLAVKSTGGSSGGKSAGVILIGPIPIIFGSDKQSIKAVVILAIVLMLIVLVIMLLPSLIGR